MAYNIRLTKDTPDGPVLTTISDQTVDTTTSLTLIGRNYAGYGEFIANDFVHLLENFSNDTSPSSPLIGQIWWDSANGTLKVCVDNTTIPPTWAAAGITTEGDLTLKGTTPHGALILENTGATTQHKWRIRVGGSTDIGYDGMLLFEALSDDGVTVLNTVMALDGVNNLVLGTVSYS